MSLDPEKTYEICVFCAGLDADDCLVCDGERLVEHDCENPRWETVIIDGTSVLVPALLA